MTRNALSEGSWAERWRREPQVLSLSFLLAGKPKININYFVLFKIIIKTDSPFRG